MNMPVSEATGANQTKMGHRPISDQVVLVTAHRGRIDMMPLLTPEMDAMYRQYEQGMRGRDMVAMPPLLWLQSMAEKGMAMMEQASAPSYDRIKKDAGEYGKANSHAATPMTNGNGSTESAMSMRAGEMMVADPMEGMKWAASQYRAMLDKPSMPFEMKMAALDGYTRVLASIDEMMVMREEEGGEGTVAGMFTDEGM